MRKKGSPPTIDTKTTAAEYVQTSISQPGVLVKLEKHNKSLSEKKGKLHPPTSLQDHSTGRILLVLGCSKVFVATMGGELCSISFHIPSGCTLVVSTAQGFNPKAKPNDFWENKG